MTIPDTVASLQDFNALIIELRECLKWLTHEEVKKKAGATETASAPQMSQAAGTLMQEYGTNKEKLEELLQDLEKMQRSAKVITITLAGLPSNTVKAKLVAWCRKEIAPDVLVNFDFNKGLLGGMVVRAGSHVYDWSFRRLILDKSDTFPEVLRRV